MFRTRLNAAKFRKFASEANGACRDKVFIAGWVELTLTAPATGHMRDRCFMVNGLG